MKRIILTCLSVAGLLSSLFAGQAEELFHQANEAYQANDFARAAALYEQVDALGMQSFELQYNLGNAFFQQKNVGKAVLHYERALLISPDEEDALHNLSVLQSNINRREQLPDFFLINWWRRLQLQLSSGSWGLLAMLAWWIGFAGLACWRLGKTREQRKAGFMVGATAILLSLLPFALAWSRLSFEQNSGLAIVLLDKALLKSAPDTAGTEVLTLAEGEKVELLDHLGGYWQVRLSNGEKGWVAEDEVEEI